MLKNFKKIKNVHKNFKIASLINSLCLLTHTYIHIRIHATCIYLAQFLMLQLTEIAFDGLADALAQIQREHLKASTLCIRKFWKPWKFTTFQLIANTQRNAPPPTFVCPRDVVLGRRAITTADAFVRWPISLCILWSLFYHRLLLK